MINRLQKMCFALLATFAVNTAFAETYLLHPQDKLMLRAMRWDAPTAGYVSWDGVSGEYTVSPGGTLMIPLVGQIVVEGKSAEELAATLELDISRQVGMAEPPRMAVEVIDHLPIYVLGDVNAPGAYPYRPGLSAQQAMALAGGPLRIPLDYGNEADLQPLRLGGEITVLTDQLAALAAERQRLIAEIASLENSDEAVENPLPAGLEAEILAAAQAAREGQGQQIRDLQFQLNEQIDALRKQMEYHNQQIETTRQELENVSSLKEKGLVVNTRVSSLTNALNDLESKRLDLEIALLLARQQLSRAQRDELELLDNARSEALVNLNAVQQQMTTLRSRLATAQILHGEVVSTGLAKEIAPVAALVTRYQITRSGSDAQDGIEATTELMPGDTLNISRVQVETPLTD